MKPILIIEDPERNLELIRQRLDGDYDLNIARDRLQGVSLRYSPVDSDRKGKIHPDKWEKAHAWRNKIAETTQSGS